MTESDYLLAANLVKARIAASVLRDILPLDPAWNQRIRAALDTMDEYAEHLFGKLDEFRQ